MSVEIKHDYECGNQVKRTNLDLQMTASIIFSLPLLLPTLLQLFFLSIISNKHHDLLISSNTMIY
jgi:hypothetical protein